MDFVQYTVKAYNLLLLLVDLILGAIFGPFRLVTIFFVVVVAGGIGAVIFLRRSRRPR